MNAQIFRIIVFMVNTIVQKRAKVLFFFDIRKNKHFFYQIICIYAKIIVLLHDILSGLI